MCCRRALDRRGSRRARVKATGRDCSPPVEGETAAAWGEGIAAVCVELRCADAATKSSTTPLYLRAVLETTALRLIQRLVSGNVIGPPFRVTNFVIMLPGLLLPPSGRPRRGKIQRRGVGAAAVRIDRLGEEIPVSQPADCSFSGGAVVDQRRVLGVSALSHGLHPLGCDEARALICRAPQIVQ
jgi:hypothetical protein